MQTANPQKTKRIPNAQVNKAYHLELQYPTPLSVSGIAETGLSFDSATNILSGTPTQAGEYTVMLAAENFMLQISLTINPDPRMLWRNEPSDPTEPYAKADQTSRIINHYSRCIVAASERGRSHAHTGKPRDDHFAIELHNNWYMVALADGAGSAQYSRRGSQLACDTAMQLIRNGLDNTTELLQNIAGYSADSNEHKAITAFLYQLFGNAALKAYNAIVAEAKDKQAGVKDYATTLLISICRQTEAGWFVASFQIGDGAIGLYINNKEVQLMGKADSGEFAGQTRFLTMPEVLTAKEIHNRLNFTLVPQFAALILMTDGVSDARFETENQLSTIEPWNDLWNDLNAEVDFAAKNENTASQLLKWLSFWSAGNHDDRTIAVVY